jgi:hypothetical protein
LPQTRLSNHLMSFVVLQNKLVLCTAKKLFHVIISTINILWCFITATYLLINVELACTKTSVEGIFFVVFGSWPPSCQNHGFVPVGVSKTRRCMVPHPYEYCSHELHISKSLFMLSLPFILLEDYHIYFLLTFLCSTVMRIERVKREDNESSKKFNTIIQACFMIHNTYHSFAYNTIYHYACFAQCKSYHFMRSYCLFSFSIYWTL